MTRNEKIKKLCNAVRRYRGRYNTSEIRKDGSIKWSTPPDYNALGDVCNWLKRLGKNESNEMAKINDFKTFADFNNWIATL